MQSHTSGVAGAQLHPPRKAGQHPQPASRRAPLQARAPAPSWTPSPRSSRRLERPSPPSSSSLAPCTASATSAPARCGRAGNGDARGVLGGRSARCQQSACRWQPRVHASSDKTHTHTLNPSRAADPTLLIPQGDYYYHNRMDPTDKDVMNNRLNRDRTFGVVYKVGGLCGRGLQARAPGQPIHAHSRRSARCRKQRGLHSKLPAAHHTPPTTWPASPPPHSNPVHRT